MEPPARRTTPSWTPVLLLVLATVAALGLRVSLGRGIGYPTDMVHYVEWADKGARHPLGEAYARTAPNYPPGAVTLFWLVGKARATWPVLTRADNRYLSMKAPAILGDLIVAWLVFLVAVRAVGRGPAAAAAAFYLFNPAVISDSTLWGQSDGLVPIFPLLALWALQRGAWWAVGPCLAAALAVKFQSVTLVATVLVFVLADAGVLRTLVTLGAGALTFGLIALPFALAGQLRAMVNLAYLGALDAFPSLRFGALNFWDVLDPAVAEDDWVVFTVGGVPVTPKVLGIALFAVAWVPAALAGAARRDLLGRAYAVGIVAWAFFMFPTRIHERYLLPAIAFFTAAAARGRPTTVVVVATASAIHLYSCYFRYSWGGQGVADMMGALLVPIFVAAVLHLRTECLTGARDETPRGAPWLVAIARTATAHVWAALAVLGAAALAVALLVGGWFHARTDDVALARLGPYRPTRAAAPGLPPDRVRGRHAEVTRFRFPPVFARLRAGIEVGGTEGGACLATFAVRAPGTEAWTSAPIPAGSGIHAVDVPLPAGASEVSLSAQGPDCPPSATYDWIDPRLAPWAPARGWNGGDTLHVSDLALGAPWPLSLVSGEGAWRRDRSVRGGPLSLGGRRYAKGVGLQGDSVLAVPVPDGATAFASDVGAVDGSAPGASGKLRFVVLVDGSEAWRSGELAPGVRETVRVPLDGARRLTLVVESTGTSGTDPAAWADARFLRGG